MSDVPGGGGETVFRNSGEITLHRVGATTRPYLVIMRAGSQPRRNFFASEPPAQRSYDLALNYYAPPHPADVGFWTADIVVGGGLSKFHGAKRFLEATGTVERYRGVWLIDDDLDLLFDLDTFLAFCENNRLDLAQPSVANAPDSFATWRLTLNHPGLVLRLTNFVEVMAPYFSRAFLQRMLHSFDIAISTWGLDIYWGHHLGESRAAIVDAFQMKHLKPPDPSGPFYAYLKSIGVDQYDDLRRVFDLIGRDAYDMRPLQFFPYPERLERGP